MNNYDPAYDPAKRNAVVKQKACIQTLFLSDKKQRHLWQQYQNSNVLKNLMPSSLSFLKCNDIKAMQFAITVKHVDNCS